MRPAHAGAAAVSAAAFALAGCGSSSEAAKPAPARTDAVPVLLYHQLGERSPYSVALDDFRAQLDELRDRGYRTISLAQYQAWLAGSPLPVSRPILITFDDGFASQAKAGPELAARAFSAVLFVVTGFASGPSRYWMSWDQLRRLEATGRWELAFHAGAHGHVPLHSPCKDFYVCRLPGESLAAYERRVTEEVAAGTRVLSRQIPGWSHVAWAAPYDAAGQFAGDSNDPRIPGWVSRFFADRFSVVFLEDRARGLNRRYRFQVKGSTTLTDFRAALGDAAFGR